MRIKSIAVAGIFAAATILPLSAASKSHTSCTGGEPTPASSTRNFAREGASLIQGVQMDAYSVLNHADTLVSYKDALELDWQAHASELSAVRVRVNDMGRKLYQLEAIRQSLPEWQQRAIARIQPAVLELANSTTAALNYLNANQGRLENPNYVNYTKDLYAKASSLNTSLMAFENYAKANSEEAHLEHSLGLKKAD